MHPLRGLHPVNGYQPANNEREALSDLSADRARKTCREALDTRGSFREGTLTSFPRSRPCVPAFGSQPILAAWLTNRLDFPAASGTIGASARYQEEPAGQVSRRARHRGVRPASGFLRLAAVSATGFALGCDVQRLIHVRHFTLLPDFSIFSSLAIPRCWPSLGASVEERPNLQRPACC